MCYNYVMFIIKESDPVMLVREHDTQKYADSETLVAWCPTQYKTVEKKLFPVHHIYVIYNMDILVQSFSRWVILAKSINSVYFLN